MFTGIIKELGVLIQNKAGVVQVRLTNKKTQVGESIAINGVCLTVTKIKKGNGTVDVQFDLSEETVLRTTFKTLSPGTKVNVEPALSISESLGGHIVQGHVDGVGRVVAIKKAGEGVDMFFSAPKDLMRYVVPKGSMTVDGVSLTAVHVDSKKFSVALIPFTLQNTNLGILKIGDPVNLEADIIAKYVAKYTNR